MVGGEGELDQYKKDHPEMFLKTGDKKGELQKKFAIGEDMIERCKKDDLFMGALSGEHQAILVCMLCGVPFKCKIDSLVRGKALVDLKTTREMHKQFYIPDFGHVDFISYYGYINQLAIYREMVKELFNEELPCFIAPVLFSFQSQCICYLLLSKVTVLSELQQPFGIIHRNHPEMFVS